jgi:NAD(P) transhydrogenase subunit alpha
MNVGVVRESYPGERRVALVPAAVPALTKAGVGVLVEAGCGAEAGYPDDEYGGRGATVLEDRAAVFGGSDILLQVRTPGANRPRGDADRRLMRSGQVVIGLADPLADAGPIRTMAEAGATLFAMELMPRSTRAQAMDVLSSQATVQGYKAVILAASHLPKMFPMMMTAAGTLRAAAVFVIGAGVAGLQAIATARRLGGVVKAYDIRAVVKEQVESLGARFLQIDLPAEGAEDKGGYAKAMDDSFYRRQGDLMREAVSESDVVVTTAAVPGKRSPVLVTADMVRQMRPGSVIVDLAAERGGNCELTRADEVVVERGVTILGPTDLPSTVPHHASQMYAKNVTAFLLHMVKKGELVIDTADEIVEQTLLTRDGEVVHERVRQILGIGVLAASGGDRNP